MDAPSVALYNQLKAAQPFFLLAGPNVIESEEHVMKMAKHIKAITTKLGVPLVFKSSFDKANRTSSKSFRGPGLEQGLKILEKVKAAYDLPVVTDVHESCQCEAVGRVADIIQIPAFLCRQTDLLVAAAKTGKIINIKKGQFCASSVMANSTEKIRLAGNQNVMVYDLIVDPRNFEWLREANCPVVADVTHALQQPAGKKLDGGGVASGGLRELIPCIARTAVAVGVDGIFMEPLRNLEELLEELIAIAPKDRLCSNSAQRHSRFSISLSGPKSSDVIWFLTKKKQEDASLKTQLSMWLHNLIIEGFGAPTTVGQRFHPKSLTSPPTPNLKGGGPTTPVAVADKIQPSMSYCRDELFDDASKEEKEVHMHHHRWYRLPRWARVSPRV
uniref:3-deoxy-8-phosphooctulonate synthase n=1 Tax=Aegilops tauschii TaxID=37682 RepID=M8B392_AEGTA